MDIPKIISRKEALALGLPKYFTGKPCKHGHLAEKNTKGGCRECVKIYSSSAQAKKNGERYRANLSPLKRKKLLANMMRTRLERKIAFPYKSLIKGAKDNSRNRGLEFSLTYDWGKTRWTGKCELTGIPFVITDKRGIGAGNFSPSIDRVNSRKGYTPDNCRFILMALNFFKYRGSDEEMYLIAEALLKNR